MVVCICRIIIHYVSRHTHTTHTQRALYMLFFFLFQFFLIFLVFFLLLLGRFGFWGLNRSCVNSQFSQRRIVGAASDREKGETHPLLNQARNLKPYAVVGDDLDAPCLLDLELVRRAHGTVHSEHAKSDDQ